MRIMKQTLLILSIVAMLVLCNRLVFGQAQHIDNLLIQDNSIAAKNTNGGVGLVVNGSGKIALTGDIEATEYITHAGDTDTFIRYLTNRIFLLAGNAGGFDAQAGSFTLNPNGDNTDIIMETDTNPNAFVLDAGAETLSVGVDTSFAEDVTVGNAPGDLLTVKPERTFWDTGVTGRHASRYIFDGVVDDSPEAEHDIAAPSGVVTGTLNLTITGARNTGAAVQRYSMSGGSWDCQVYGGVDTVSQLIAPTEEDADNIFTVTLTEANPGFKIQVVATAGASVNVGYTIIADVVWTIAP